MLKEVEFKKNPSSMQGVQINQPNRSNLFQQNQQGYSNPGFNPQFQQNYNNPDFNRANQLY